MPGRRPMAMRTAAAGCCLALLTALTACGTETSEPEPEGAWTEQRIDADPGADSPVGFAADGDDVLVVVTGDDGRLQSHLSTDGGDFVAGEPFTGYEGGYPQYADPVRRDGTWWLVGSGGLAEVKGDEELLFEPRVLRSPDGLAWEAVDVQGITGPVELQSVAVVGDALVAVGTRRPADSTASEGFTAAAWRSEDGSTWTETPLPDVVPDPSYRDDSGLTALAGADGRLVAAGHLGRRAAMWASEDEGRSWSRLASDAVGELSSVSGLVADGSTLVASGTPTGSDAGSLLLRSDDGGDSWVEADEQPAATGEGYAPLWSGGGHYFTVSRPGFATYDDPAVCYADLDACALGGDADVTLVHHSSDGEHWGVLAAPDPDTGDQLVGVVGTASGRVLVARVARGGVVVNAWPAGADLPEGDEPTPPARVELVTVPEGEDPEPGVRYHAPLYIHCGMDWLYLGDQPWQRTDDGAGVETGAGDEIPEDWPVAGQTIYGFATLTDAGVVEYSTADGEVIATYERPKKRPPGCD